MLNADRLTVKAAEAFNESLSLARANGNPLVYDGPLLLALLAIVTARIKGIPLESRETWLLVQVERPPTGIRCKVWD